VTAQAAFILLAVSAAIFFAMRKTVDPLAIAFGATLVYFTPGFSGEARFSYGQDLGEFSAPIVPLTYAAMAIVIAALVGSSAITDRVAWRGVWTASFMAKVPGVVLGFVAVASAVSVAHTGTNFLCLDKNITLANLDPWYSYAALSVPFLVASAYALRQRLLALVGCIFLIADMYAGFRTSVAITFLAVAMLSGERLFEGRKSAAVFILIAALAGSAMFVAKALIVPAKYATRSYCEAERNGSAFDTRLNTRDYLAGTAINLTRLKFYFAAFVAQSEQSVVQATLNEVVRRDFRTGAQYLIGQILPGVPLGESLFGIDSRSISTFNTRFQPALFPSVSFGMANNPWAQAYAAGGLFMVAAFALIYSLVLGVLTILFRKTEGSMKAGVAVLAVWIGFYFHRNDLYIEIVYLKHVVYIFALAALVALVLNQFSVFQRHSEAA